MSTTGVGGDKCLYLIKGLTAHISVLINSFRKWWFTNHERIWSTYIYVQYLSYPRTLMFVSNTETTTSLSNETSWTTSLTAFSNSSTSPKTLKKREISGKTTVQKFKNKEFRKIIRLKETNNGTRNLLLTCPKCQSMSRKTLKTKQ